MSPPSPDRVEVVAAEAVVTRKGRSGREVLLVHRPKYDDWSFAKGKQDPGEHVTATAVREVEEETGLTIRLGRPLLPQLYTDARGRAKKVHYWVGHPTGEHDVSAYPPNDEIDSVGWFPLDEAARRLTYLDDLQLLQDHRDQPRRTTPLVVLRHAISRSRESWRREDPDRPLAKAGLAQAEALVPVLAAYGVTRVLSSSSARCTQTVQPYAAHAGRRIRTYQRLTEEDYSEEALARLLRKRLASRQPAVICTHRPVLPVLLDLLGVEEEPLDKGELVVVHHRNGRVVATERHLPA